MASQAKSSSPPAKVKAPGRPRQTRRRVREPEEVLPKLGDALSSAIAQSMTGGGGLLVQPAEADNSFVLHVRDVIAVTTSTTGDVLQWLNPDPDYYKIQVQTVAPGIYGTPWPAPQAHPKMLSLNQQGLAGFVDMKVRWIPTGPLATRGGFVTCIIQPSLTAQADWRSYAGAFPGWEYIFNQIEAPISATQASPVYANMDAAQAFTVVVPCLRDEGRVDTFGESLPLDTRLLPGVYERLINKLSLTLAFSGMTPSTTVGYLETEITVRLRPVATESTDQGNTPTVMSLLQPPQPLHPAVESKLDQAVQGTRDSLLYSRDLVFPSDHAAHAAVERSARSSIDEVFDWGSEMLHRHGPGIVKRLAESAVLGLSDGSQPFAAGAAGEAAEAGASAIIGFEDYLFGGPKHKIDEREF